MTRSRSREVALLSATLLSACAHVEPIVALPAPSPADQVLSLVQSRRPDRFRMVHQVAAHFQDQTHVLVGYLLGRRNGDFRVSASAAMGPRVFDVVKVGGRVEARAYLPQIQGKLDPRHVARAIELVYFVDCPPGSTLVARDGPVDRYRCAVSSPEGDVDELEMSVDSRTLSPVAKVFLKGGTPEVTVRYGDVRRFGDVWLAAKVHLGHRTGPALDIALVEYHAPADFGDDAFVLPKEEESR